MGVFEMIKGGILIGLACMTIPFVWVNVVQKNHVRYALMGVLVLCVLGIFSLASFDQFLWGWGTKGHGLIWLASLILVVYTFSQLRESDRVLIWKGVIVGGALVALYAIFERCGLNPHEFISRVPSYRTISTLGNANYVAGFGVLLMALGGRVFLAQRFWRILAMSIGVILVILSGSMWSYVCTLVLIGVFFFPRTPWLRPNLVWLMIGGMVFMCGIHFLPIFVDVGEIPQRLRGFLARPAYWMTSLNILLQSPHHFLLGIGPDNLVAFFDQARHPLLNIFEDPAYIADRSHNALLDVWLFWGIIPFLGIVWLVYRALHVSPFGILVFVWVLYFSFNIPVTIHFLVLGFSLVEIFTDREFSLYSGHFLERLRARAGTSEKADI